MEYHLKKLIANVGTRTCVSGYQSTTLLSTRLDHDIPLLNIANILITCNQSCTGSS